MPFEIVTSNPQHIKSIKIELEGRSSFVKPITKEGDLTIIKTTINDPNDPLFVDSRYTAREYNASQSANLNSTGLVEYVHGFLKEQGVDEVKVKELLNTMPLRYTIYPPLLLFNYSVQRSFKHATWTAFFGAYRESSDKLFNGMLETVFSSNKLTNVAINMPIIETDIQRRPFNILPLFGDLIDKSVDLNNDKLWESPSSEDFSKTLWCHVVQNGIDQYWAPAFTMFSRGNVKEKKRILSEYVDIEGNDVVDLYAGIGYFTLSYLKRKARNVFCFELNPWSVEGLRRGIAKNKFADRAHVYCENNENSITRILEYREDLTIRHINLGLLPSSRPGWKLALDILSLPNVNASVESPLLCTLHVHENIHIEELNNSSFVERMLTELTATQPTFRYTAAHVEKIKTFAPDVWHVCIDVEVLSLDTQLSCS
ncbi:hypothetical protein TPHA_0G00810 [Tetrapisispora phaffii CBS 4417]|uniref:tRNA wybutosine-synthesizing protein 2 n=1 Tax=Tetrapisispora phaffii (strain ATCC 24235 / CBS 4417 / NBRC 1672 / NRRL Y-8282 / UCD 70-5) TaxID=1071381 RepID=G8BVI9_TETPH|nr:hypothetical protein TPHA_0G00810 [Tetrapisispora phaffii CBS 4417]CCE63917.1 hypothetical protein TPHA_0G00810 [Tetrapisispora phaffii CBS 4417]